jgi:hypothetical protein
VASAILADVEPGILPGGQNVKKLMTEIVLKNLGSPSADPGGKMPPFTAGRDACRYLLSDSLNPTLP